MAKNFKGDFTSLLDTIGRTTAAPTETTPTAAEATPQPTAPQVEAQKRGRGRPRKATAVEEQRTTLVLPVQLLKELQAITYAETGKQGKKVLYKDIVTAALQQYVDEYQSNNK